jgi:DNA (cytosine-5)-methyltransferase 1
MVNKPGVGGHRSSPYSSWPDPLSMIQNSNTHDAVANLPADLPALFARADAAGAMPLLSFFTGAGFLDIGFAEAGFPAVWHNEIMEWFVRGYEFGMSKRPDTLAGTGWIECRESIAATGPNEIFEQAFQGGRAPGPFGIVGGPPCPDFSVGGKNRGQRGERGKLSEVYIDRILELNPAFFLFENVPGLLRTKKHRGFFDKIRSKAQQEYVTDVRILNALDYGVPQDRERVFFVGFERRWFKRKYGVAAMRACDAAANAGEYWFPWDTAREFDGAKAAFRWPATSPFRQTPLKSDGIPEELTVHGCMLGAAGEGLSALPNGKDVFNPYSQKFHEIDEGDDSRKSFKRLHRWRYSPAAAYGNNEVHLHPVEPRRLTVREAMRIQTVPDWYCLPPEMPLSHKFKTIGNGVPVKLARAVALAVRNVLTGGAF